MRATMQARISPPIVSSDLHRVMTVASRPLPPLWCKGRRDDVHRHFREARHEWVKATRGRCLASSTPDKQRNLDSSSPSPATIASTQCRR